jgi:RNA polymerase sigma factor (sigma-70 family)
MNVERTPAAEDGLRDFRAIYRAHYGFVWHALHRFGVAAGAVDDAVQDVFVVAYRRRATYRGPSPKPWLYGIARRVASNHRRSTRRRAQRDQALPRPSRPGSSDGAREAIEGLERYLAGLRAEDRELFVLSELEGMTGPELASVTGRNVQTLYTRVRKLKVELGQQLGGPLGGPGGGLERVRRERPQATARGWALLVPALRRPPAAVSPVSTAAASGWGAGGWGWVVGVVGAASLALVVTTRPASERSERAVASTVARTPTQGAVAPAEPPGPRPDAAPRATTGEASPAPTDPAAPAPTVPVAARPAARALDAPPRAGRDATPPTPVADGLGEETALLRRASTELAAGQAEAALRITGEHGRRFPDSALADVRAAVRIEALCALGKAVQARGEAELFLRQHPGSPVAERIERACTAPS